MKKILAFETSCDDTAVAIIDERGDVLAECIASQIKEHAPYLGVVPEIGSRAHIEQIVHVTNAVFLESKLSPRDVSAVAATCAPGLLGPLLVGAQFAKGFSLGHGVPFIAIHHIEGHIFSGFSDEGFPAPPFVALIASGGHTALYRCNEDFSTSLLGQTLDDAAGEAFDKIGRALGFGYPAGKIIDKLARLGEPSRFSFPVALKHHDGCDFSFSGLKTRVLETIKQHAPLDKTTLQDLCASAQEAIALALSDRCMKAVRAANVQAVVVGGGVAANSRVRDLLTERCLAQGLTLYLPKIRHCTDNAVMIARAALIKMRLGLVSDLQVDVRANLSIERANELTIAQMSSSSNSELDFT